tara:strand:- start:46 stop:543 length:498 start_codon:yes stop_codon:yes gene_type:complete
MNTENKSFTDKNIKDLWQTPRGLFHKLNEEFLFECDVAASDKNHFCSNWITEKTNALTCDWMGVNWCNHPYSDITPWIKKAIEQHKKGRTIVMLVPADTSVKWFKLAYDSCNKVRFISGRISFINADTQKPVNGNNKGSVIFVWDGKYKTGQYHTVDLINRADLV